MIFEEKGYISKAFSMDWRSRLLRISPVLYNGIEEWCRTEKKITHWMDGLLN